MKLLKNKVFIISLSAILVLGIAAAIYFATNSNRQVSKDVGNVAAGVNTPAPGASNSPADSSKPKRKVYPIGEWDKPVPYINPFGSQNNYETVEYLPNSNENLLYIGNDNLETSRIACGEVWTMDVSWQDTTASAFDDLSLYLSELGAEVYSSGDTEGSYTFHVTDSQGTNWWGKSMPGGSGYRLTVYKEFQLYSDKPLTFKTSNYPDNRVFFISQHPGDRFISMTAQFPQGEVRLVGTANYIKGGYNRGISYDRSLYAYKTQDYVLDDIPQESSTPMLWEMSWSPETDPVEVTLGLEEGDSISPVKYGERLGALKIKGAKFGSVLAQLPPGVSISHPDLSNDYCRGDITPEGDILFWLPSGYWNLMLDPGDNLNVNYCETGLIPVSEGEMTVLTIPQTTNEAYVNPDQAVAGQEISGVRILETREEGDKATVTFMVQNAASGGITPSLGNTEITEGGQLGRLISLERVKTPPSVVLVLDSSGSMKGQMENAVSAAKTFIEGLPDNASIQVIDLDTTPRVLEGTTKTAVLKGLASIKANGATALYDSILKGLELLTDKERPTLVVFTDGVDANGDDTGPGSSATKDDVLNAVKASGVSVFTIGFGPKHDNKTLLELAGATDGMYYPAQDKTALVNVFNAINNKLGNTFTAVYERPEETSPSDVPVICLVMDTSGSMDTDPAEQGCGYRIDKVKKLYHEFIKRIPEGSQVQMLRFSEDVTAPQITTTGKPELMQALGKLQAGMGTETITAMNTAYAAINPIPSNKRVIVFMTDAAVKVDDPNAEASQKNILSMIKKDGIQTLWVGLGVEDAKEAFQWVADQSGGKYVISEDPAVLGKAFDDALATIQEMPADKLALTLTVKGDSNNNFDSLTATRLVDFPILKSSNKKISLNTMKYETGIKIQQYDQKTASLIYGTDLPSSDVKIVRSIPFDSKNKNKAMEWSAKQAYFLYSLKGVKAPQGKAYMAVEMEMKNIHPDSIPYQIPDMLSHFFTVVNNGGAYPASTATWLTETPLIMPGENILTIQPGETAHGVLVFLVPDEQLTQLSLNFYDTAWGHINLPLIGKENHQDIALETLPTSLTGKLSDTFSISISAEKDLNKIENVDLTDTGSVFRVLEGGLSSNVQAILDIVPMERFYLKMSTQAGPFMVPVNVTTSLLPYGFMRPVALAPGSQNKIRFSFQIPSALKDTKMDLYGDINGGAMTLPIGGGQNYGSAGSNAKYPGDGMTLTVNSLARVDNVAQNMSTYVVADITIADTGDGLGTTNFENAFSLVRQGYDPNQAPPPSAAVKPVGLGNFGSTEDENVLVPSPLTQELLLGMNSQFTVYDGESRRAMVVFEVPGGSYEEGWVLKSPYFSTLSLDLPAGPCNPDAYKDKALLVKQVSPPLDNDFDAQLAQALTKAIQEYQSIKAANPTDNPPKVSLNGGNAKNAIPAPAAVVYGLTKYNAVKTAADFQNTMNGLKWVPSIKDQFLNFRYSPEAVLTQGWGSEGDLARMAGGLLAKLGYSPHAVSVRLTAKGIEALKTIGRVDELDLEALIGWAYTDEQGQSRVYVVPFMKDLSELKGLAYISANSTNVVQSPLMGRMEVYFDVASKQKSAADVTQDISGVLGGASGDTVSTEEIRVLYAELPLDELSKDSIDLRITGKDKYLTALLENGSKVVLGDEYIDTSKYRIVNARITLDLPGESFTHETRIADGDDPSGVFFTLAINLPDLPAEASKALQKASDNAYKAAVKPDELSTLRWYTRGIINKFVAAQTEYENKLAEGLGVTVGRTVRSRCILVTVQRKDEKSPLLTSVDLLQPANQLHSGSDEAKNAFNIMSGIYSSRLEGVVLPGNKTDFMDIWANSPADTTLFLSTVETRTDDLVLMREQGFPEFLVTRAENNTNKAMLMPDKPTVINGQPRWAWLEIDQSTYETVAVIDTGEHGSFAEYLMTMEPVVPNGEDYREFAVGAFIGIDSSVWAVSAFSLNLDDPKEIMENAKAYTYAICDVLDQFMNGYGLAKREYGIGPAKLKINDDSYDYMAKYFEEVNGGKSVGGGQNYLGFTDGFKAGAAYYFKKMEESLGKD